MQLVSIFVDVKFALYSFCLFAVVVIVAEFDVFVK